MLDRRPEDANRQYHQFDITSFADVRHVPPTCEELVAEGFGHYWAFEKGTDNQIGQLQYRRLVSQRLLIVANTYTQPGWRNRKVAAALIEQMCKDNPDYFVDVGRPHAYELPTPEFYYSLRQSMPYFNDTVTQEGARGQP